MGKKLCLVGQKFKRLTVIRESGRTKAGKTKFMCICDCGKEVEVVGSGLVGGNSGSCGCLQKENSAAGRIAAVVTHGLSGHPIYRVWIDIRRRCYDPRDTTYHNYGARGIGMCPEWKDDFKPFYDWCMANGWEQGLEVDRYPDNNGDYEPTNCRITTRKKNCNNKRMNVHAEIDGVRKTAAEWAEVTGKNKSIIATRIKKGITGVQAVFGVGSGNKFQ